MVDFNNLMDLQFEIFILMIIGYILRKTNIISKEHRKSLTDLVIYIVLPANIIYSFMIKMDTQIIKSGLTILIVSIIIQFACQVFGKYFFIKATKRQQSVLQYGTICSNAGFMGSPLIQGLYGLDGLLFASIYLIPQRIVMWSGGVACFTNAKGKDVIKKVITHPCIIAVFIGLFIMIGQIQLPSFLKVSIQSLSNCTMALSMIVIGGILAEIIKQEVAQAKQLSDIVIVSVHWGNEFTYAVNSEQKELANYLNELGVDVIIGHHSHCIQPIEWLETTNHKTLVVYSLGSFISADNQVTRATPEFANAYNVSMILQITFEKNNNSTIIKNINSLPVINYYDQKFENFKLVPIDKYNEKLEKSHNRYSKGLTKDFITNSFNNVIDQQFKQ